MTPFSKTGGLADVAGSLPVALGALGVEVAIMMPRYRGITFSKKKISEKVTAYAIENEAYFNRASYYGNEKGDYPDNLERFTFFCRRALALAEDIGFRPDIVHANDWQAALLPVLLKTQFANHPFFKKTKSILTVHNLAYQGHFPAKQYSLLELDPSLFSVDGFEFYGKINLLKAGLLFADKINTVSPTYAKEIKTRDYGYGLEGVIRKREKDVSGILNGIDTVMWDPAKDKKLKNQYFAKDLEGKKECKADLQKRCGFEINPEIPVFTLVTRLAEQKGLDLLSHIADKFLEKKAQLVVLGEGDPVYHTFFKNLKARHPQNTAVFLGFDTVEAHRLYAGADFFLMPSLFEPCGLGQLISFRYGTVPIVRSTGGLADTVIDVNEFPRSGNGILFKEKSPEKLLKVIERALALFQETRHFEALQKYVMTLDFSWERSAQTYKDFYKELQRQA